MVEGFVPLSQVLNMLIGYAVAVWGYHMRDDGYGKLFVESFGLGYFVQSVVTKLSEITVSAL